MAEIYTVEWLKQYCEEQIKEKIDIEIYESILLILNENDDLKNKIYLFCKSCNKECEGCEEIIIDNCYQCKDICKKEKCVLFIKK